MRDTYQKAMTIMAGQTGEPGTADMKRAHDLLSQSASFPPAMAKLAVLELVAPQGLRDDSAACEWFLRAAKSGFPPAVRGLAVLLLSGEETRPMGAGLLRRAAQTGDWAASFLILREAMRGRVYAGKEGLTQMAARLPPSVPFLPSMTQAVHALPADIAPMPPTPFREDICRSALIKAMEANPEVNRRSLHKSPNIAAMPGALAPLECDYLIAVSAPLMQPSKVVDADEAGAVAAGYRTSDGAVLLPAHMDFPAVCLLRRLSAHAGIAPEQGEFLSLLRYRPGQEYRPHHDYLLPDAADYSRVKACGQRRSTLLTYLNGGYAGGETAFPDLDITFKGSPGDALWFENTDGRGKPFETSLHAGAPVTSGEKWLMTLWCREKPFWPWMRGAS